MALANFRSVDGDIFSSSTEATAQNTGGVCGCKVGNQLANEGAKSFESPVYPLSDLLRWVHEGKIQLLDFQRKWKWDNDRIRGLLSSISLGHPVGILNLHNVGEDVVFNAQRIRPNEKYLGENSKLKSQIVAGIVQSGQITYGKPLRRLRFKQFIFIFPKDLHFLLCRNIVL